MNTDKSCSAKDEGDGESEGEEYEEEFDSEEDPGGDPHIWPIRVCAAEQSIVFKVLSLKLGQYNSTIERLEQRVFLDWKPFEECEDLR